MSSNELYKEMELMFTALIASENEAIIISDDTVIDKYFDFLDTLLISEGSMCIIENKWVQDFLKRYANAQEHDLQMVCMALKLASKLGVVAFQRSNNETLLHNLYDVCDRSELWADASVRSAWVHGLNRLCENKTAFEWIANKGYVKKAIELPHDESLFVNMGLQKLVCNLFMKSVDKEDEKLTILHQLMSTRIIAPVINPDMMQSKKEALLDCITVLSKIFSDADLKDKQNVYSGLQMETIISHLVEKEDVQICEQLLSLLTILDCEGLVYKEHILRVSNAVMRHLHNGHTLVAMKCAIWCQKQKLGGKDTSDRMTTVIKSPIFIVLECDLETFDSDTVDMIVKTLQTKNKFNRILSLCIEKIDVTGMNQNGHGEIVDMLLKLMRLTIDSLEAKHLQRHLNDNSRIQLVILEAFINFAKATETQNGNNEKLLLIWKQCSNLMETLDINPIVFGKILYCLCEIFKVVQTENTLKDLLQKLVPILQKKTCDLKWEVRDSVVEFLGNLAAINESACCMVIENGLHKDVWQSTGDGESYVRAAALTSFAKITTVLVKTNDSSWVCDLKNFIEEKNLVSSLCDVIKLDSEAFSRRAALDLATQWALTNVLPDSTKHLTESILQAIKDLDWEVKLKVLHFCEKCINKIMDQNTKDAEGVLMIISDEGFSGTVLIGLEDYDNAVKEEAARLLRTVVNKIAAIDKDCIARLAESNEEEYSHDAQNNEDERFERCRPTKTVKNQKIPAGFFCQQVLKLDLESLVKTSSQSIDEHVKNPSSLFQDILNSIHIKKKDIEEDDGNVIDCY